MDIILLKDIEKVGEKYAIVSVKNGFARNYLIPQGFALIANDTNRRRLDDFKSREARNLAKVLIESQAIADKLEGQILKIGAKAGTSGKIFGSVTNLQLANALKEQLELDIDRRKINIPDEVKVLGEYVAEIDLHPDVEAKIRFEVLAD